MQLYDSQTTRVFNLRLAIAEEGSQAALARRLEYDTSYVSQLVNAHRNIGSRAARTIEKKLGRPKGWLDTPQPEIWKQRAIKGAMSEEATKGSEREWIAAHLTELDEAGVAAIVGTMRALLSKKR